MNIWKKYNGALIPSDPPHIKVKNPKLEIIKDIILSNSFFARWISDFDCNEKTNFWYVINDENIELSEYSANTRSKIRRGLKHLDVRKIKKEQLIKYGFEVYKEAFKRYKTLAKPLTKKNFYNHILFLDNTWEFWGVFDRKLNKMIAYSENKITNNQCNYSTIKFHADYLKMYPSYALYYVMNNHYLGERMLKYVNEGARSILHETNVQNFIIEKFKFRKAYCYLHIQYNPLIIPIIYVLYPFRNFFLKTKSSFLYKIGVVLKQEELRKKIKC